MPQCFASGETPRCDHAAPPGESGVSHTRPPPHRKVRNSTVDKEALAKALAEKTGQDISLANYFLDALYEFAAERIATEQVRINVGTANKQFHFAA